MRRHATLALAAGLLLAACTGPAAGEGTTLATTTSPATTTTGTAPTTTTASTTSTTTTTSAPTTTAPTTTTTTPPEGFPEEGRLNILLMGADSGVGRTGIRTDTMMVVSLDPATGDVALFGIPRNLIDIPLPPGHPAHAAWGCGCFPRIANEIYAWGLERPDLFGEADPGATAAKEILGYFLGLEIHYYALVDLQGFVDVIDALGGVDILVTREIYDQRYPNVDGTFSVVDLKPGTYHMDGHQALYYARSRHGSDDFDRMGRQRCVLQAVMEQADPLALLGQLDTIAASVRTDLPPGALPYLVDLLSRVNPREIVSIRFMPRAPEFAGTSTSYMTGWNPERYPIPDRDFIASTVATVLSMSPGEAIAALHLQSLDDFCWAEE